MGRHFGAKETSSSVECSWLCEEGVDVQCSGLYDWSWSEEALCLQLVAAARMNVEEGGGARSSNCNQMPLQSDPVYARSGSGVDQILILPKFPEIHPQLMQGRELG
jgi:hypothetical protein